MSRRVVVTGMGLLTAVGNDLKTSWEALLQGRSGVRRITKFEPSDFPTQIAAELDGFEVEKYIDKKEVRRQDPFTQYAVAATEMAVQDSGIDLASEHGERVSEIIGYGIVVRCEHTYHACRLRE